MKIQIGTSGWQYRDWRPAFYPTGLALGRWLEFYADRFSTVESNNAFYRLPEASVFRAWADRTPDDFVMAVKVSRYLTHIKRLREPAEPVDRFVSRVGGLGSKLGPVLLQLPPTFSAASERLTRALDRFRRHGVRVAVEFRHDSWFTEATYDLLRDHDAALVLADRKSHQSPLVRTADWTFVRFHEGAAHPRPRYGDSALATWVDRLRGDDEAWVFFNNDPGCWAVENARTFGRFAGRAGIDVTRFPAEPVRVARAA